MPQGTEALLTAALAEAEGFATADQRELLEADRRAWRWSLDRLIDETEDDLADARALTGPEREQVIADFEALLGLLRRARDRVDPPAAPSTNGAAAVVPEAVEAPGVPRVQASWVGGSVLLWVGGPSAPLATAEELPDWLERAGAPGTAAATPGSVRLPSGERAAAVSLPLTDALGWLVTVGAARSADVPDAVAEDADDDAIGYSVAWLGRVALLGVRLVAAGAAVPRLRSAKRREGQGRELAVEWQAALVDEDELAALAASMPGAVVAAAPAPARSVVTAVLDGVVDAIVTEAAGRIELPAPPPVTTSAASVAEAFVTRLDGSPFTAPAAAAGELANRLDRWSGSVTAPSRPVLVVQLDPPDEGGAWFLSVLGAGAKGTLMPVERALADSRSTKALSDELTRLERLFPVLLRPGGRRRGEVYLSQSEAWELMTQTGPALRAAGFDVRVPVLSRRKPAPSLRLFTEPSGDTAVGAHQLADVRWSVVFDDVELTADELARLAAEATPLVRSRGQWVQLDAADLQEAARALAERSDRRRMTGAEILRHAIGLEGSPLAGGVTIEGGGWAAELLERARSLETEPVRHPEGFLGELRSYQADALGWLGFLDAVGLGGCLALDMGLGKTATVLAHLARTRAEQPTLVIAPPAVVGNWAAEARRFTPSLQVVVHHGASRASAEDLEKEVDGADVVITTFATAVRDVDALAQLAWDRIVVDEAQAIKNPVSETARQLRLIPARTRLALTGTPIENGLGDLWSILDFTNPGLLGPRAAFVAQLSGEHQEALRALNGILLFRRTKAEPAVAAELPDRIDELDHCVMTAEQVGLYQAVLDRLVNRTGAAEGQTARQGDILAAITALKQICNHPAAYHDDGRPLAGRSGKLTRLEEIVDAVFAAGERILVFTHFAEWGKRLAEHLTEVTGVAIDCYHGGLARGRRDAMITAFQEGTGPGALVLSLKAGGTGLNLTAANHVVLYDRWWNPAVEDQARDRAWRIGQTRTVVSHRLVCPGTVDERVEEVVAGKRHVADLVLPKSSSLADLDADQLRFALGLRPDELLTEEDV